MRKFADAAVLGVKWGIAIYICVMLYAIHVQLEAIGRLNYVQAEVLVSFFEKSQQAEQRGKRY